MFHTTLMSILNRIESAISAKEYPITIIVGTPIRFIREAIQWKFEIYCAQLGLTLQKRDITPDSKKIEIEEFDLFSKKQAILYSQSALSKKKFASLESLFSHSQKIDQSALFLFHEESDDLKKISSTYETLSIASQKPWDIKKIITEWSLWYLSLYKIQIEEQALSQIIDMKTPELSSLQSQLDLLITYSFEKKKIRSADVELIFGVEESPNMFQLLDGLLAKSSLTVANEAEIIIQDFSYQLIQVLRFLQSQLRLLIGYAFFNVAPPYKNSLIEKRIACAKKLGYSQLENWIEQIISLEVAFRTGNSNDDKGISFTTLCHSLLAPTNSQLY